jgi:hypothetical protein
MTTPDLDALLGKRRGALDRTSHLPDEVRVARRAEKANRANAASALVQTALRRLHPEDYAALYEQAKARIAAERGPLPGDES